MNWSDLVSTLAVYAQQEQADASFTAATPYFVQAAENRIYRDLDISAVSGVNYSLFAIPQSSIQDLSNMTGQTVLGTAVAYPYPVVVESLAARVLNRWIPYQLTSRDWLDYVWPDLTLTAAPVPGLAYYTVVDPVTVLLAPVPDQPYPLRIAGTWRPAPMSAGNPSTYLGTEYADLLFSAVMVEVNGYQRSFGAMADDPRAAISWEKRYSDNLATVRREEFLRQGLGVGFSPYAPAPMAGPPPNAGSLPTPPPAPAPGG
jgi:hypothetical protein